MINYLTTSTPPTTTTKPQGPMHGFLGIFTLPCPSHSIGAHRVFPTLGPLGTFEMPKEGAMKPTKGVGKTNRLALVTERHGIHS